jgi:hypothetical protein
VVVRAEDDRRPLLAQREDRLAEDVGVHRIEPGERLVEAQQLGLDGHRPREPDLLAIALERDFLAHPMDRRGSPSVVPPRLTTALEELERGEGMSWRTGLSILRIYKQSRIPQLLLRTCNIRSNDGASQGECL